jgi:hypothetical protein
MATPKKATPIAQIRRGRLLRARDARAGANPPDTFILVFPCLEVRALRASSETQISENLTQSPQHQAKLEESMWGFPRVGWREGSIRRRFHFQLLLSGRALRWLS